MGRLSRDMGRLSRDIDPVSRGIGRPSLSALRAVLLRVAALPGSCRLHIGTSTHSTLMLLDPHVSLHVYCQLSLLCELFDTDCALVFLDALMNLLMDVPCLCMN